LSQRRRIGRLRAELAAARPAERPQTLGDLGDPLLVDLGQQVLEQEWLDRVEQEEHLAEWRARGIMPPAGFQPRLEFERHGVRRLPPSERLLLARRCIERYWHATRGQPAQDRAPEPEAQVEPSAEPAQDRPPEPDDDRVRVRLLRSVGGRSGGEDFQLQAGDLADVPPTLARRWLQDGWAEQEPSRNGHRR